MGDHHHDHEHDHDGVIDLSRHQAARDHYDDDLERVEEPDETDALIDQLIGQFDNYELTTVGVDVGSSTSHLMFARIHLRRLADSLSSRFVVVSRKELFRSPITLTPYRSDGMIDVEHLERFIDGAYADAGMTKEAVDAGAVILTGAALERANARAIAELFAAEGGKFVCATAGHNLEALLAAHGSGAVALSRDGQGPVLNIDIGGGTTKFALADGGGVVATLAIGVGARLLAVDETGQIIRIEHGAAEIAERLGIQLSLGSVLDPADRARLVAAMADHIIDAARGNAPGKTHPMQLAGHLSTDVTPTAVVFSGGVSEYLYARSGEGHGDLGPDLAAAVLARKDRLPAPIYHVTEGIRATVVGASQFTVQVSGNTILVTEGAPLPLRNVPVVSVPLPQGALEADAISGLIDAGIERMDMTDRDEPVALTFRWDRDPLYRDLIALAKGIEGAHARSARAATPIVLAFDGDVGESIGRLLTGELGWSGGIIAIDGLELLDLDFIDVGELVMPINVVPVVVKSLVFPTPVTDNAVAEDNRVFSP